MSIPVVEWSHREGIPQEEALPVQTQTVFTRFVRIGFSIAMLGCIGIMLRLAS